MKDSKKLNLFKETLKKAKEGDLYNYDRWLKNRGFNPRKLTVKYVGTFFQNNPDLIIGHEESIELIAEKVGEVIKEREISIHIPIIGVDGSGKTLFLKIIDNFMRDEGSNLCRFMDNYTLNRLIERDIKNSTSNITSGPKPALRIIDECETFKDLSIILKKLSEGFDPSVYLTSWTPESWLYNKDVIMETLPFSKIIKFEPFQDEKTHLKFLENIFKAFSLDDKEYPQFYDLKMLNSTIFNYSSGIPNVTIDFLIKSLEEAFRQDKDKKVLDLQVLLKVAETSGLEDLRQKLSDLSPQHYIIFKRILFERFKEGTRPIDILEDLDLDKSTISYHLNNLAGKSFIEMKKIGKYAYYRVKDYIIPFIQLKLMEDV